MIEAPIWQQSEGRDTVSLTPWHDYLVIDTHNRLLGPGPSVLLPPEQVAALRDALTAWLDEEATA